jgi:heme-degrading monooxygenase HmoA
MPRSSESIFRIDKFDVPAESRAAFLARLKATHAALSEAEGCLQNYILEQVSGSGRYNVLTLVQWRDVDAYDQARAAAQARYEASNFDPSAVFEALGIDADLGNYVVAPL